MWGMGAPAGHGSAGPPHVLGCAEVRGAPSGAPGRPRGSKFGGAPTTYVVISSKSDFVQFFVVLNVVLTFNNHFTAYCSCRPSLKKQIFEQHIAAVVLYC